VSGKLGDGTPLRQDALAQEYGVSRIPVREALQRLESEGLVASFPHRGSVVTALSPSEIIELFELRAILEPDLIARAIPKMTPEILEEAQQLLEGYGRRIDSSDVVSWGEINTRYHMALYSAADRPKTMEIVRGLLVNTDRYTRVVLSMSDTVAWEQEHAELLDLCRRGAVNQAVATTLDHIQRASAELLAYLDQQGS
jgi:DNA-binding GntR family transcriptional regulator